jgi:hypothetical protein
LVVEFVVLYSTQKRLGVERGFSIKIAVSSIAAVSSRASRNFIGILSLGTMPVLDVFHNKRRSIARHRLSVNVCCFAVHANVQGFLFSRVFVTPLFNQTIRHHKPKQ